VCWDTSDVIGRLEKTVIDCPDPRALAEFYCQVLGMRVNEDIGDWVVIGLQPGLRQLAFQRAAEWHPFCIVFGRHDTGDGTCRTAGAARSNRSSSS
jgi:catechol 2,3-dioxygenase-like lactoylglutathione lyase family enzyme